MIKSVCWKCGGKGEIKEFSGIAGGVCFACNGSGEVFTKTAPKRSVKFAISAQRKTSEQVVEVFFINAKTEAEAVKIAQAKLANGTGYFPGTAKAKEV